MIKTPTQDSFGFSFALLNMANSILAAHFARLYIDWMNTPLQSFIRVRGNQLTENNMHWLIDSARESEHAASSLEEMASKLESYCQWEPHLIDKMYNQDDKQPFDYQNWDTYKQLKSIARQTNPDITKEEIYEQLLKPFRYEKVKHWDSSQRRHRISYFCRYAGWDKEFIKTWNLLDHVRMHEGVKPFICNLWGKTFTQKGNLIKHNIVQHSSESLEERKKFRCNVWDKGYTERYNLIVSLFNNDLQILN